MNARFFLRQILLALSFMFFFFCKIASCFKISRKHVDKTVFLSDSNCYWQSICSEELSIALLF